MNLQKLFEMQAKLDKDITAHHPVKETENRLEKKVLALLVELGECANEWRGFKFWSNDQEPREKTKRICVFCLGKGGKEHLSKDGTRYFERCNSCNGAGEFKESNPLLEEYVDCLHFILSIGNDIHISETYRLENFIVDGECIIDQFNYVFENILDLSKSEDEYDFVKLLNEFYILGLLLGFTWEQVEQAYYDKNKVNFERQEQGY